MDDALPHDEASRAGVRQWLFGAVRALPPEPDSDDWTARRAFDSARQQQLHAAGYAGLGLPEEYGGRPVPLSQLLVVHPATFAGFA